MISKFKLLLAFLVFACLAISSAFLYIRVKQSNYLINRHERLRTYWLEQFNESFGEDDWKKQFRNEFHENALWHQKMIDTLKDNIHISNIKENYDTDHQVLEDRLVERMKKAFVFWAKSRSPDSPPVGIDLPPSG